LTLLFGAEVVALNVLELPLSLDFTHFFFGDQGANLTIQYLVAHGYRPNVDFGYHYGLLPILFGRVWFGLVGATPVGYQAAMVVVGLLMAWALARLAANLQVARVGLLFLFCAMPFAIMSSYGNFAHALEAVLLCNALAEQAASRYPSALVLATAACFAKPAMGYIYGALLLVLIVTDCWRRGSPVRALGSSLLPAALVGVGLMAILCFEYGVAPLLATILPVTGMRAYRSVHLGFFTGEGRSTWYFPGVRPGYYVGTQAGLFLAASAVLLVAGVWDLAAKGYLPARDKIGPLATNAARIVIVSAVMQTAFVALLYGGAGSWHYYSYLIPAGLAAGMNRNPIARKLSWLLVLVALVGNWTTLRSSWQAWCSEVRSVASDSLWAQPERLAEWERVLSMVGSRRAVLLATNGGASLLGPGFVKPEWLWIVPGLTSPGDVARIVANTAAADLVVVAAMPEYSYNLPRFPAIERAIRKRRTIAFKGRYFEVWERSRTVPAGQKRSHK
jgi:hypothetical protein